MKAAYINKKGPAEAIRYGELPIPRLAPGQALVKVLAAAVNPIDTYVRSGDVPMEIPIPFIPGCDLAGVVEAVGAGVRHIKEGDRVWASNQGVYGRQGTFAEYAAVDAHWLYPIPEGQSEVAAAAGALTGITAHLGLFSTGKLRTGELVFVNGGTGGVGSAVVQLAKGAGAKVVTTAGSETKRELCRQWGADLVLDYRAPDLDEQLRLYCEPLGGIDLWFETRREPAFDRIVSLMAYRGRIILMAGGDSNAKLPVGPFYFKELRLLGLLMMKATPKEQRKSAIAINRSFSSGKWHPQVGRVFPLTDAAKAHAFQEESTLKGKGGLSGKIVVVPGSKE